MGDGAGTHGFGVSIGPWEAGAGAGEAQPAHVVEIGDEGIPVGCRRFDDLLACCVVLTGLPSVAREGRTQRLQSGVLLTVADAVHPVGGDQVKPSRVGCVVVVARDGEAGVLGFEFPLGAA